MIVPGGVNANLIAAAFPLTQIISADTADLDIAAAALAAGWDGTTPLSVQITIDSGKYLYASSTSAYAFDTGTGVPDGSVIRVINNGTICGAGGAGGNGGANSLFGAIQTQSVGSSGGVAVKARCPVIMVNNGIIAGGGGGGGGGGYAADNHYFQHYYAAAGGGGGGGRGYVGGAGGASASNAYITNGGNGTAGAVGAAGAAGAGAYNAESTCHSGAGGAGGDFGAGGAASSAGSGGTMANEGGTTGGAAGAAVDGNSFVTWEVAGTILGAQA